MIEKLNMDISKENNVNFFCNKHIYCNKCGYAFMFSSDEQLYFEKKNLFPRKNCHSCSTLRKNTNKKNNCFFEK